MQVKTPSMIKPTSYNLKRLKFLTMFEGTHSKGWEWAALWVNF